MRLHFLPGSAAMAPHAALAEAGADYELVRVTRDEQGRATPEYLALNPSGRVPTLEIGGLVLTESAAIVIHVADAFPEARLLPEMGTDERSDAIRWLMHLTNTVQPTMMRFLYPERYGTAGVKERAHEGQGAVPLPVPGLRDDGQHDGGLPRSAASFLPGVHPGPQ